MATLTFAEVDAVVSYNPLTGSLRWKTTKVGRMKAGEEVGYLMQIGYRGTQINRVRCLAHQIAWLLHHGAWPTAGIDHINGDRADNRACNLRLASQSRNMANRGRAAHNRSGFKGVSRALGNRERMWVARIGGGKDHKFLGYYATPEAAHEAYRQAAIELYGEFARSE